MTDFPSDLIPQQEDCEGENEYPCGCKHCQEHCCPKCGAELVRRPYQPKDEYLWYCPECQYQEN